MNGEILLSYIPLFLTSMIASHTPGPNNIMLLQRCTIFGYKKTHSHRWGIVIGFLLLAIMMNIAFAPILEKYPKILFVIRGIGTLYFTWLSYKIIMMDVNIYLTIHDSINTQKIIKPMSFWQAFFFQWVNVKAIFYALSLRGLVEDENEIRGLVMFSVVLVLSCTSSTNLWSLLGAGLHKIIKHLIIVRVVNILSGIALLWFCATMWL